MMYQFVNILLLSQLFSTSRGGGEYVFSIIAKKLAQNGHQVFVITNRIKGERYQGTDNVKVVFVPPIIEYRGGIPPTVLENLRYSLNAIIAGLKIIKKGKIDIIHSNYFAPAIAGSVLSSLTGRPHIITIHDVLSLCGKNYWKIWADQYYVSRNNLLVASLLDKLILRLQHSCIHTVSETTRDDLVSYGERKPIHVIYNTTDQVRVMGVSVNPHQLVYVGRLVFSKNLEIAIRAVGIARKKESKIQLVIVGDGPHRATLEKIVSGLGLNENVQFLGHVSEEQKSRIVASSAALVFPSVCEGFGIVILEAFLQSRPALVANVRPMSEIVSHGKTGFVIDPYDATAWAEHFLRIIENPQEADSMGKNGYDVLMQKYSQDLMYQKIISTYESLV